MQILKRSLLLLGVTAFALTACKDDDVAAPVAKVNSVTVTPDLVSVRVGLTQQLVATVDVENDAATTVTWSTSDQTKATVGATTGVVSGVAVGVVVITATSTVDANKKGTATVNVVAGAVLSVEVLPAEVNLFGGETQLFAAVVNTEAGVGNGVTWRISDPTVATINTTTGLVTALANATASDKNAVVTAVSSVDTTKRGSAVVHVKPGTPPSGVISVNVTPGEAFMRFTDPNQVFTATVIANPGVSGNVNWSVSDPTKVQIVSSTSTTVTVKPVSAAVTGQVGIIAKSAVDANRSGTAILNILPPLTPATVSISQINIGGTGLAVNPLAVAGGIDVVANIDPGDFIITKLELLVDGLRVAQQDLAPSSVAADAAGDVSQITLSYNTGRYSINGIAADPDEPSLIIGPCLNPATVLPTGHACPDFQNGAHIARLRITTSSGSLTGTATSIETNLVFVNVSGYHNRTTNPTNSAIGTNGQSWFGGPSGPTATVQTWPVRYDGDVITSITHCISDLFGGSGPFGGGFPFGTATCATDAVAPFSSAITVAASNQFTAARAFGFVTAAASADLLPVAVVPVNAGNGQALLDAETPISIDNTSPLGGTYFMTMVAPAQDAWANATYNFATTANYSGNVDNGVGLGGTGTLASRMAGGFTTFQWAPTCGVGAGVFVSHTLQTTGPITAGPDITPSTCDFTNGAFIGQVQERDRLGNQVVYGLGTSNPPINNFVAYGVDKTVPAIRYNAATEANLSNTNVFPAVPHFLAEYQDDRAGFGATPQAHMLAAANANTPDEFTLLPDAFGECLNLNVTYPTTYTGGVGVAGASFVTAPTCTYGLTAPVATLGDGFRAGPSIDLNLAPASAIFSYYTYDTRVTDKAGNVSTTNMLRTISVDGTAPLITGLGIPGAITAAAGNGPSNSFVSTWTDNVEVNDGTLRLIYPAVPGGGGTMAYPRTNFNTRFDNIISGAGTLAHNVPFGAPFVRGIEAVVAVDSTVDPAAPATQKPIIATATVFDVFGNNSALGQLILAGNVENGVPFSTFNTNNALQAITKFYVRASLSAVVPFIPLGLKAEVLAPFNAINAPFVRVDFYRQTAGEMQYLGSASAATNTDNGVNRFWTYTLTQTPLANTPTTLVAQGSPAATNLIIAVGVTAAGDGLATTLQTIVP